MMHTSNCYMTIVLNHHVALLLVRTMYLELLLNNSFNLHSRQAYGSATHVLLSVHYRLMYNYFMTNSLLHYNYRATM
jgi:hypothetical protein